MCTDSLQIMASSLWFIAFSLVTLSASAEESSEARGKQPRPQTLLGIQNAGEKRTW